MNSIKSIFIYFVGTVFFLGYTPFASGTVTTLFSALTFYFIPITDSWIIILIPLIYFIGHYAASELKNIHGKDPRIVTIDEVVGFLITMLFIPKTIFYLTIGFILFRILDIVKPYPANYFDNKNSANGIMLDDVFAGMYSNLILQIIKFIFG